MRIGSDVETLRTSTMSRAVSDGLFQPGPMVTTETKDTLWLGHITWPDLEHYGHDHAQQVQRLAMHLGEWLGLGVRDLQLVRLAGLLHELGRTQVWQRVDPAATARSAVLAEATFRRDPDRWGDAQFRADACGLIAAHRLSGPRPWDLRLQALRDADLLEEARYAPGTPEGRRVVTDAYARLCTPWARQRWVQERWLRHRGWTEIPALSDPLA